MQKTILPSTKYNNVEHFLNAVAYHNIHFISIHFF